MKLAMFCCVHPDWISASCIKQSTSLGKELCGSAALILHYAKWLWNPRMDGSRSHSACWEKISWACHHGHKAVSVVMATQPSISSRCPSSEQNFWEDAGTWWRFLLFIAAGSRCTLVSMNKRRAGREINNEHAELKLEAVKSVQMCVCV